MTELKHEIIENDNLNGRRALASIQKVDNVLPVKGSDRLVLVEILGFRVIVAKNTAPEIGALVIYIDADSIVTKDVAKMAKIEIKTDTLTIVKRKILGVISDGIIISPIPSDIEPIVGKDVTNILQIKKSAEVGQQMSNIGVSETSFEPCKWGMHKTDEIQVLGKSGKELLAYFQGKPWSGRLKVDGSSSCCMIHPNSKKFMIFSRNEENIDPKSVYHRVANQYKIKEKLENLGGQFVPVYEVYGSKIQRNRLGLDDGHLKIAVFDVFDLFAKRYLVEKEMIKVCQDLDLPVVPLICSGPKFNFSIDELRKLVQGNYEGTKNPREGIVFRLQNEYYTNIQEGDGHFVRASFKVINDQYKIAEGKVKQSKIKAIAQLYNDNETRAINASKDYESEVTTKIEQVTAETRQQAFKEEKDTKMNAIENKTGTNIEKPSLLTESRALLTKKISTEPMTRDRQDDLNACLKLLDQLETILTKYQ